METRGWRLSRAELTEWMAGLLRGGKRVIAPVQQRTARTFRAIESAEQMCLDSGKTRWSPKEFVFPRTETLFSFSVRGGNVKLEEPKVDEGEQVLFGVRPCDAAGLTRLDSVFLGNEVDSFYAARRARSTVVSLACDVADADCFCTAVGGSPGGEAGSDVQVIKAGEAWLVRPLSAKGEALTAAFSARAKASADDWAGAQQATDRVAEAIRLSPIARESASVLESNFALPLWEALGHKCVGCSICSYVCPSCSCFDVQDQGNAWCGERCRSWDACTFGLFTRHASGHNPRNSQGARFRQRVLHKFAYFPETNGEFMCVGCGRCVKQCPVGMNIHESVQSVVAAAQEGTNARH